MTPHPDICPHRLSELATRTQGTAGIPTVIPTKCRDTAGGLYVAPNPAEHAVEVVGCRGLGAPWELAGQ